MKAVRAVLVIVLAGIGAAAAGRAIAQTPPAALELVAPALLSSPLHQVRPEITFVGPMATFEVDTDFGELEAQSVELLAVRVEELAALEKISLVTRTEMYLRSAKAAGSRTARAVGTVVSAPVETARGIPEGVRRLFSRKLDSAKRTARDLGDEATDAARDRPDYAGQIPATAPETPRTDTTERAERAATGFALNYIGYNKARREAARLLEVDPYTSNPILNAKLDDLAWATLAGGFSFGKALALATGGASEVISKTVRVNQVVWEKSPEDVRVYNEKRLLAIKLSGPQARKFLRNGSFSPTLQSALVSSLDALGTATGRTDVLDFAGSVRNELEARFLLNALWMLEAEAARGFKLYSLAPRANALVATGWDGEVLIPLPVDYLSDSGDVLTWVRDELRPAAGTRLLVAGIVSASAARALEQMMLRVEADYAFPQRPPYAQRSPD
jgi:hypothetical protein